MKKTRIEEGDGLDLGRVAVSAEVAEEIWLEGQGDYFLGIIEYSLEEIEADLEHDRMMHAAWGDHIPVVITLPLAGSKCDVIKRRKTPRP